MHMHPTENRSKAIDTMAELMQQIDRECRAEIMEYARAEMAQGSDAETALDAATDWAQREANSALMADGSGQNGARGIVDQIRGRRFCSFVRDMDNRLRAKQIIGLLKEQVASGAYDKEAI